MRRLEIDDATAAMLTNLCGNLRTAYITIGGYSEQDATIKAAMAVMPILAKEGRNGTVGEHQEAGWN